MDVDEDIESDDPGENGEAGGQSVGAVEAKSIALEQAEQLLSNPVEDVIEVQSGDGEWHVAVESLEREAVPDTQDIIARYEFTIAEDGSLAGYSLVERYRRGDMRGGM